MDGWSPLDSPRAPIIPAESSPKDITPPRLAGGEPPNGLYISPGGFGTCARAPIPSPSETSDEATRVSLHHGFASSRFRQCAPLPAVTPKTRRAQHTKKFPPVVDFFLTGLRGRRFRNRFSVTTPETKAGKLTGIEKIDIITTVSFRVSLDETRGASDTPPFAAGRRKASPVAFAGHSTRRRTTRATTVEDASDLQGFGRANTWEA